MFGLDLANGFGIAMAQSGALFKGSGLNNAFALCACWVGMFTFGRQVGAMAWLYFRLITAYRYAAVVLLCQ